MPIVDVILTITLSGFVFYGFFFGLIRMVGNLAGLIVGAWFASHYYLLAYNFIERFYSSSQNLIKILTFLILLSLVSKAVSLLFIIIDKTYHLLSIIPFLKTINRLAGAIFGFFEGSLAIGLAITFAAKNPLSNIIIERFFNNSQLTSFFLKTSDLAISFFPNILALIKRYI